MTAQNNSGMPYVSKANCILLALYLSFLNVTRMIVSPIQRSAHLMAAAHLRHSGPSQKK